MKNHPFKLPKAEISTSDFTLFCNGKLGVVPGRVLKDVALWLEEDCGHGDISVINALGIHDQANAYIVAKQDFLLSGLSIMAQVFREASGGTVSVFSDCRDGDWISKGTVVLGVTGSAAALLIAERTALNLVSKLSGIATKTNLIVKEIAAKYPDSNLAILETRKTTPGLRIYEKYATRTGGGRNHRHGLDAGAMLKENHLRALGGIKSGLSALKNTLPILSKVEVEVTNLEEFRTAVNEGAQVIMLDNFSWDDVACAVRERNQIAPLVCLEVSGNLDGDKLESIVKSGVDFASMGALIHKANWTDLSMQLYPID